MRRQMLPPLPPPGQDQQRQAQGQEHISQHRVEIVRVDVHSGRIDQEQAQYRRGENQQQPPVPQQFPGIAIAEQKHHPGKGDGGNVSHSPEPVFQSQAHGVQEKQCPETSQGQPRHPRQSVPKQGEGQQQHGSYIQPVGNRTGEIDAEQRRQQQGRQQNQAVVGKGQDLRRPAEPCDLAGKPVAYRPNCREASPRAVGCGFCLHN